MALLAWVATTTQARAQVSTFNFTGADQLYTLPAGASGVTIRAAGAGGAGGGADADNGAGVGAGVGGSGGSGATASGTYLAASGTQLKIYVGGGGTGGVTSNFGFTCTNSAGVAGSAGGINGFAGGNGGLPGCGGYSGGGGGGGGASVVSTFAGAPLFTAGGGGGGQGGSWGSIAIAPSIINSAGTFPPGSAGAAGATPGAGDGGGGGGGGGGCAGGAGGSVHNDLSGTANGTASRKGGSCAAPAVTGFSILAAVGGSGGAGSPANPASGNNPRGTPGGNGSVTITPIFFPTLNSAKSQPAPALAVGSNSTYTITISNTGVNPAGSARVLDQLPANLTYVSGIGAGWVCTATANAGGTLVTCNFTGTIAATTGTSTLQVTVTPTTNAPVTNYASVDPTGSTNPPVPTACTAANTPSAGCAAPVVSSVGLAVSGRIYNDANHNASLDGTEGGTAVAGLFVKLAPASGGTCTGSATIAESVNAVTGAYSIAGVAQGSYCLILDNNNTLSDITAGFAAGWIGTQNASGIIFLTVGAAPPAQQNFGKFNGSILSGTVFADTGVASGTSNNGIQDGGERGLPGVTVNAASGATIFASAITASDGSYMLWLPPGTGTITPVPPSGYLPTGGSPGTSGGSYTRPSVSGTVASGATVVGVNFGLVPPNALSPNGTQTAQPGNPVFYDHVFLPASGGQVTFALANSSAPASPAWTQQLYRDNNCNGTLDAIDLLVTSAITATAGQPICLIVKQFVPAGASVGAQNTTTLGAVFSYTNAVPALSATLGVTDVTTVGQAGALVLDKSVINCPTVLPVLPAECPGGTISANAAPGDVLEYKLIAVNNGTGPVTTLVVSDATPAFTTFVAAACSATLPAGVTACSVSTQPSAGGAGSLQWTFTGSVASGAQLRVVFRVKVNS